MAFHLAIQCLCDDPAHHLGWSGGWGPVLAWLVVMVAAIAVPMLWARLRRRTAAGLALPALVSRAGPRCPYCHGAIVSVRVEPAFRCPACEVQHHVDCWREHGGCSLLGCEHDGRHERAQQAAPQRH